MRTGVLLLGMALAAAPASRPFTWTLELDDAGNGTWAIDCSFQERQCTMDFDGGVPSPLRCPGGSHCTGSLIPPDPRL
jgi:hypothetical protein